MSHVPVRYIDRLNRLARQLCQIRVTIEDLDPSVSKALLQIEGQLGNALMAINREDPLRAAYLAKAVAP